MRYCIQLLMIILVGVWVSCSVAAGLLPGKPTVQSYQTSEGSLDHAKPLDPAANAVQPSMAQNVGISQPQQQQQTSTPSSAPQLNAMRQDASAITPAVGQSSTEQARLKYKVDALTAQTGQLSQMTLLFEQKADARFEKLETANKMLQNKVDQLAQQVQLLNGKINILHQQVAQLQGAPNSPLAQQHELAFWLGIKSWLIVNGYYLIVYGVLAILLIVFVIILFRGNQGKKHKAKKNG